MYVIMTIWNFCNTIHFRGSGFLTYHVLREPHRTTTIRLDISISFNHQRIPNPPLHITTIIPIKESHHYFYKILTPLPIC